MRWIGALVADTFRILQRGGIYLYPSDGRPGYENGRLRLVYECRPVAFLVEQAGGRCTTGRDRVLDLTASSLHARAPLIFGATDKVQRVERLHETTDVGADSAPLFARRGLFRV
jgi:fructose-1,6-bisphosphatase I